MSKAYKCDRCGKLYSNEATLRPIINIMLIKYHNITKEWKLYDLCNECDKELKEWFRNVQSETN